MSATDSRAPCASAGRQRRQARACPDQRSDADRASRSSRRCRRASPSMPATRYACARGCLRSCMSPSLGIDSLPDQDTPKPHAGSGSLPDACSTAQIHCLPYTRPVKIAPMERKFARPGEHPLQVALSGTQGLLIQSKIAQQPCEQLRLRQQPAEGVNTYRYEGIESDAYDPKRRC